MSPYYTVALFPESWTYPWSLVGTTIADALFVFSNAADAVRAAGLACAEGVPGTAYARVVSGKYDGDRYVYSHTTLNYCCTPPGWFIAVMLSDDPCRRRLIVGQTPFGARTLDSYPAYQPDVLDILGPALFDAADLADVMAG
jgi:hypothetical protein